MVKIETLTSVFFLQCTHNLIKSWKWLHYRNIKNWNVFLLTDTYLTIADGTYTHKNPHCKFFYQFILIYWVNIGNRAILNKNIGIIGHFLEDRDIIGNIGNIGTLEGLNRSPNTYKYPIFRNFIFYMYAYYMSGYIADKKMFFRMKFLAPTCYIGSHKYIYP